MNGQPRIRQTWLEVPCDAPDIAKVYMAVGATTPRDDQWQGAFRDTDDKGVRVAKIKAPAVLNPDHVWLKVDGVATRSSRRYTL